MTKVTKTEKILRKATSKWEKFIAEGAFKKTLDESMDFRKAHFAAEMEPEELELLNIPEEEYKTKSKEEVEAIAAALDKAHKESQYGVIMKYPKTATYDENEPILRLINKKRKATRAITGEKGYVHYSDEESKEWADSYSNDMPSDHHEQKEPPVNEMTMGERGMVDAQDGNPPSKIGGGNEEYMAAYNAVMQKMGKEPLDIVKPDQAYLDALRSGQLEEQEKEADPRVVAMQQAIDLLDDLQFDSLESALDNMNTEVVRKLGIMLKQLDYNRNQVGNIQENEKKSFKVGEFVYVVNGSLKGASGKILEPVTTTTGEEGFAIELYSAADKRVFGQRGDEVIALAGDLESGGTSDDMELYDIDEAVSGKEQYYLKQQNRAKGAAMALYHEAGGEGTTTPGPFVKSQARIIVDAMVALERMITSDGIDERSADDERDLEEPVKYGSGAELEFDPKAQKFYDRKRDIYLDDEEADALIKETVRKTLSSKKKVKAIKENNPSSFSMRTTHSSDPEMDQVMDIAADMLEMPTRSRGTITLKSVQSALEARSIDSVIENDMLIIDNKYVIAKKELLPKTAQKISFTKYAADYLSNLQGEQQNLPMEEEQARTTMSSDPHLDQIEDYALTVIEKGGNLRQLEDVLNRDGFATFLKGDVLTIDDEFFVGNEENFDISPDEDIRRLTGSNLVAGRTN